MATVTVENDDITEREAHLLCRYGPLEMARVIDRLADELEWIAAFATVRSQDESKVFARVNRGALRNIANRATEAAASVATPQQGD